MMLPRSPECLGHAFHGILVTADVHARHTRNFSYPPPKFLITRRHNKASPLLGHLDQTVICIASLAVAWNTFEPRILGQPQSNLVLGAQLLQFSHDTVGDAGDTFGQQTVHHRTDHIQLIPNRKVEKVCIH